MVQGNNEMIFKIYTYVDFDSNVFIEQNDLIVLNVYSHKYIEIIVYMIQEVGDKVSIHCSPDLTQFILRVTQRFKTNELQEGILARDADSDEKEQKSLKTEVG